MNLKIILDPSDEGGYTAIVPPLSLSLVVLVKGKQKKKYLRSRVRITCSKVRWSSRPIGWGIYLYSL